MRSRPRASRPPWGKPTSPKYWRSPRRRRTLFPQHSSTSRASERWRETREEDLRGREITAWDCSDSIRRILTNVLADPNSRKFLRVKTVFLGERTLSAQQQCPAMRPLSSQIVQIKHHAQRQWENGSAFRSLSEKNDRGYACEGVGSRSESSSGVSQALSIGGRTRRRIGKRTACRCRYTGSSD